MSKRDGGGGGRGVCRVNGERSRTRGLSTVPTAGTRQEGSLGSAEGANQAEGNAAKAPFTSPRGPGWPSEAHP